MRLFLNLAIAFIACIQCAVVSAQAPTCRAPMKLGMSGTEVRKILGTPLMYRDMKAYRSVSRDQAGVLPVSIDYDDIYELTTPLNTYELRTEYGLDDSESRLHPVPRLIVMHFELDKRISIDDFAKILDDVQEIAVLCGEECTLAGGKEQGAIGGDSLYLHPKTIMPAEMAEAERIGSIFGMFPAGRGPFGERKPTVRIIYEQGSITQVMLGEDGSVFEGPVRGTWKPQKAAQ